MYTPADFGALASFSTLAIMLSLIATGSYEHAIPIIRDCRQASLLTCICATLAFATALILAFILVPLQVYGLDRQPNPLSTFSLWLLPLLVFCLATVNTLAFWLNRNEAYALMARGRVLVALFTALACLLLGILRVPGGLIVGAVVAQATIVLWIAAKALPTLPPLASLLRWPQVRDLLNRLRFYPLHLAPSQLLGSMTTYLPVLIFARLFGLAEAGHFFLAHRITTLPAVTVSTAIGTVYRQRIVRSYHLKGHWRHLYLRTTFTTAVLGMIPYASLLVFAPWLFSTFFGQEWQRAGEFARPLAVAAFLQFVFTPVEKNALVIGATKYLLYWNALRFTSVLLLLAFAMCANVPADRVVFAYAAITAVLYLIDGAYGYRFSLAKQ
ncbi:MAG: oligosaccharide flippase family protein [Verrucomicrobiota bacterium]|nr:oligosaccharide flippase family protein [Limisphaera sp.]MDW8381081.1 oligosaccharide flippase family protein [Verrucomicrobiota bacterium]